PFAPFALGLIMKYVTKEAGIASIITGSIAGVYWRLAGQPYGIEDSVIGALVGVITFLIVVAIGRAAGRPPAPPLQEVQE
ncbi:MAG: sodium:solute symporter family protein, partial [Thermosphaera sp.]